MIQEDPRSSAKYLVDNISELTLSVLANYPDGVTFNVKGDKSYYLDDGVLRTAGSGGTGGYDGNPDTIDQDPDHRFATDIEKAAWNAKVSTDDSRLSDSRTPTAHTHSQSSIANLETDLATARIFSVPFYSGTVTLTNMTLADAELPTTNYRLLLDLAGFTQYRVTMRVATQGATNADLRFQYSLNDSSFTNFDNSNGPEIAIGTTGSKDTGWVSIHSLARVNNVFMRMMGKDGDGALDPVIRQVILHFK